ncbi:hypothetical protein KQ51_01358 [Candidatus Izimaplasma bacterium HR1]|jgi:hypothetical protein|uniref:hypothetical protein n=1 Tax=Candidatus Izimoplasma sp. HR1 TaxID=1541959 RepID=UPI0004F93570|nr:hypothetical protein KQ51_01358 [Candidatus Izimaplasma bacterium HR1]
MIFHRTLGITSKLIKDIEKVLYWTTIVVQAIFFAYYGYSIYTNLVNLTYLIIYTLLLALSTIAFIYFLANYRNKSNGNVKTVKKTFRIFKYVVNGSMLALNMIEIIRHGGTDIAYALIVFSSISLIIQIMVEFLRFFVSEYVTLFTIALDKDTEFLRKLQDVGDFKGNILGMVDVPLQVISNKLTISTQEFSEHEKLVESLASINKEKSSSKKKARRQENAKRQKNEIKEHFNTIKSSIFKKKNKK